MTRTFTFDNVAPAAIAKYDLCVPVDFDECRELEGVFEEIEIDGSLEKTCWPGAFIGVHRSGMIVAIPMLLKKFENGL